MLRCHLGGLLDFAYYVSYGFGAIIIVHRITARQALPNLLALPPTHVTRRRVVWRALR